MDGQGYAKWDRKILNRFTNPVIDGRVMEGHLDAPFSANSVAVGASLPMVGGSNIFQLKFAGTDRPIISKREFGLRFRLIYEEDAYYIRERASLGIPVRVYLALPETDWFLINVASTSNELWKSSRRAGWGVAGSTHETHPPKAYIDGIEQIVDSVVSTPDGSVIAGHVAIPTSQPTDSHWFYYETVPAGELGGNILQVRYWPEYLLRLDAISESFERHNAWFLDARASEFLAWGDSI